MAISNHDLHKLSLELHNSLMDKLNKMDAKLNRVFEIVTEDYEDDDEEDY